MWSLFTSRKTSITAKNRKTGQTDILPSDENIDFCRLVIPCPTLVTAATLTEYSVYTVRLVSLTLELVVFKDR